MSNDLTIDKTKPGTLNIDVDATLEALRTQYQIRSDAIVPRASQDAPDLRQIGLIRDAHLNIHRILWEYKAAMQREAKLREALEHIQICVWADNFKNEHKKLDAIDETAEKALQCR